MRHPFRRFLAGRKKTPRLEEIRQAAEKLDITRLVVSRKERPSLRMDEWMTDEASPKLFGFYSPEGVEYALREMGIFRQIEEKGYTGLRAAIDGDSWRQTLAVYGRAGQEEHLVMEGRFKRMTWRPPENPHLICEPENRDYNAAAIEWLLLQHPAARFTAERPRLPGQDHPGLGLRDEIMEVFVAVGKRLHLDAFLTNAKFFHNAYMYSPMFFFVDPERQAEITAIRRAAEGASLQDISLAVEGGFLFRQGRSKMDYQGKTKPYKWTGAPMVRPLCEDLHHYYRQCEYRRTVESLAEDLRFFFDWDAYWPRREAVMARIFTPGAASGEG